mmetsp:Transcript_10463/g.27410  ORF Transcript_10463/g.27410 Transcript_10463/m.27410 type:complete len:217 (+) Transcript_10463:1064-1714(+)
MKEEGEARAVTREGEMEEIGDLKFEIGPGVKAATAMALCLMEVMTGERGGEMDMIERKGSTRKTKKKGEVIAERGGMIEKGGMMKIAGGREVTTGATAIEVESAIEMIAVVGARGKAAAMTDGVTIATTVDVTIGTADAGVITADTKEVADNSTVPSSATTTHMAACMMLCLYLSSLSMHMYGCCVQSMICKLHCDRQVGVKVRYRCDRRRFCTHT